THLFNGVVVTDGRHSRRAALAVHARARQTPLVVALTIGGVHVKAADARVFAVASHTVPVDRTRVVNQAARAVGPAAVQRALVAVHPVVVTRLRTRCTIAIGATHVRIAVQVVETRIVAAHLVDR